MLNGVRSCDMLVRTMVFGDIFTEIALILLLATVVAAVGMGFRQPLIVAFIGAGILVGPSVLGFITSGEEIELLADMGIALLLFVVGLKLDLHTIKTMGKVALATGLGQVAFTSVFGFLIARALGIGVVESVYVAVALTFSSTVIIVKLLTDKREIDSLHGRIAVGFLIVQDIVVVLVMIALSAFGSGSTEEGSLAANLLLVAGKGVAFLAGLALLTRFVLSWLLSRLARSQELMMLFAITWAVALAAIAAMLGFSMEVGAFLAGVSLAFTRFRENLATRLTVVRDFLLLFFFLQLGARLDLSLLGAEVGKATVFSVFVLMGNPLIVMIIMGLMGYRKRTSFLAGLTVAQISEFSLILAALGLSLGHIGTSTLGLITLVGLITITLSTYLILYSGPLYARLSPLLSVFERKIPQRELSEDSDIDLPRVDVILVGLGRYGGAIADHLLERGRQIVGVDFDPQTLAVFRRKGVPVVYGDATDPDILDHLPLERTRWVVNTTPGRDSNIVLLKLLQETGFGGRVVLTAHVEAEQIEFKAAGADLVLRPFADAAEQATDMLTGAMENIPQTEGWPAALHEVRLRAGSTMVGKTIAELPLRDETGVSILAVSRAGRTIFDPEPTLLLYPGDRLVLFGDERGIENALHLIRRREPDEEGELGVEDEFCITTVKVRDDSPWAGRSLKGLDFRQRFGTNVVRIVRAGREIVSPKADEELLPGDTLFIMGSRACLTHLAGDISEYDPE
jgi:Kef-type K+ transport system membrane component KefB/Trk K+ transport system NAD-binding subunit